MLKTLVVLDGLHNPESGRSPESGLFRQEGLENLKSEQAALQNIRNAFIHKEKRNAASFYSLSFLEVTPKWLKHGTGAAKVLQGTNLSNRFP